MHIDLWGLATVTSIGGSRYFVSCYDNYTRKIHLTFLKQKSEALHVIQQYIAAVERRTSHKVKVIRSDNRGRFTSNAWSEYIKSNVIEEHFTPPDSHFQNGRGERAHLTIMNGVRRILCQTGLDAEFWAEAASYMCYTRKRTTPYGFQKQIPDDLWQQHKTKLHHLQPFGCRVFYQDYHNTNKLASCHREAI